MKDTTIATSTLDLGDGQLHVVEAGRDARLRVLQGAAWLTVEGDPADAVLTAGSEVALCHGRSLIEGVGSTRVQLVVPLGRHPRRLAMALRHAWHGLRRHVARLQLGAVATAPLGPGRADQWPRDPAATSTGFSWPPRGPSPARAIRGRRIGIRPA